MINHVETGGIDPRKHMVVFNGYEPILAGSGIQIDENPETNIPGLYAVGDEIGNFCNFIAAAVTFGWIAGKSAADRAKGITTPKDAEKHPIVEQRRQYFSEIMGREVGPGRKKSNLAIQRISGDYTGKEVRSHSLLNAGLKYLRDLKAEAHPNLKATDSHTLIRGLEVLDLIDIGETVFLSALERKETRGMHVRTDYPFTNPLLNNKSLAIRQENDEVRLEWRDLVRKWMICAKAVGPWNRDGL
jgi:succinate dehydrogenase/fumarate reductase flavoprotein subunit